MYSGEIGITSTSNSSEVALGSTATSYEVCRYDIDTDVDNSFEIRPSQPFIINGKEVLYFTAETDQNNTIISLRFSGIEERIS